MKEKMFVNARVEFYRDGLIVPIAYYEWGKKTHFIHHILDRTVNFVTLHNMVHCFTCDTDEGVVDLFFEKNRWYIEK